MPFDINPQAGRRPYFSSWNQLEDQAARRMIQRSVPLPGFFHRAAGIAHLLEHMAFKGTPRIGTKDYRKEAPLLDAMDEGEGREVVNGDSVPFTSVPL